jgi:hypothetical protein
MFGSFHGFLRMKDLFATKMQPLHLFRDERL